MVVKDRHWTTREFEELTRLDDQRDVGEARVNPIYFNHLEMQNGFYSCDSIGEQKVLLEIGCGAGNFVFPLLEEERVNFFIYACDFSRSVQFLLFPVCIKRYFRRPKL